MLLPVCIWEYILKKANWFPARAVNKKFCAMVEKTYQFAYTDWMAICKKSTPRILTLFTAQHYFNYPKNFNFVSKFSNIDIVKHFDEKDACYYDALLNNIHPEVIKYGLKNGARNKFIGMRTAIELDNLELVKLMLFIEDDNVSYFSAACAKNNPEIIKEIINFTPNCSNKLLRAAAGCNNNKIIRKLLKRGANNWRECFNIFCFFGNIEMVNLFVDSCLDILDSALGSACQGGQLQIAKILIEKGANNWQVAFEGVCASENAELYRLLEKKSGITCDGFFRNACKIGDLELINKFIKLGTTNWNGGLIQAVRGEQIEVINLMIEKGANDWNTALAFAGENGNVQIANILIEKGANNWNCSFQNSFMHGHKEFTELMLNRGATIWCAKFFIDIYPNWKKMALYLVEKYPIDFSNSLQYLKKGLDCIELLEYLVKKGATDYNNGMYIVCSNGRKDLLDYFISHGANDWNSGLAGAYGNGDSKMVDFLVKKGATNFDNQKNFY